MTVQEIYTRFRAYQLGESGSSFSYFADGTFTLIEARVTDTSRDCLKMELMTCKRQFIDVLHITSWDQDHCNLSDLQEILENFRPSRIEYPGYLPHTQNGKDCLVAIKTYASQKTTGGNGKPIKPVSITPEYIKGLDTAEKLRYTNTLCWPKEISGLSNDNSTVKIFREGSFNVASLGDVSSANIGSYLRNLSTFSREVDILILAHHGADDHTNSEKFFEETKPTVAICSSNYDNEYEHPKQEVRDRLYKLKIPIFTTKTGDVIIKSVSPHSSHYKIYNLSGDSSKLSSVQQFKIKKHHWLSMNSDTLRNVFGAKPSYRKI